MPEARVYRCSACGAPAPEGSRQCGYCRSALATIRCARCFHMNASEGRHCSACGNVLGLEPAETASEKSCPECKTELVGLESGFGRLHDCPRCDGQFVAHAVLQALLERPRFEKSVRRRRPPDNPLNARVVYRSCPDCSELMHRRNFGQQSGVIVDVCALHGMWFDRGELPRVLAFVETHGLATNLSVTRATNPVAAFERPVSLGRDEWFSPLELAQAVGELLAFVIEKARGWR